MLKLSLCEMPIFIYPFLPVNMLARLEYLYCVVELLFSFFVKTSQLISAFCIESKMN